MWRARCIALACDGIRRLHVIAAVILHEVPLDWPALEDVEAGRPKEPKYYIDPVGPPGPPEASVIDHENAAIEVQHTQLDAGKRYASEYHHYPDILDRAIVSVMTS